MLPSNCHIKDPEDCIPGLWLIKIFSYGNMSGMLDCLSNCVDLCHQKGRRAPHFIEVISKNFCNLFFLSESLFFTNLKLKYCTLRGPLCCYFSHQNLSCVCALERLCREFSAWLFTAFPSRLLYFLNRRSECY